MEDYLFKTDPFSHQKERFQQYRDKKYHAHLWEQGTGKSKITIDTGAYLYSNGKISSIVIVAPNGVHSNWIINEVPAHCPEYTDYRMAYYASAMNKAERVAMETVLNHGGLKIIAINIEAMATKKGAIFLKEFLINHHTLLVIDESTVIKNPKAVRTKALMAVAKHAKYRRILTGTPITQGPLDAYTQFTFLDEEILHCSSYYAFRNKYCIMKEMQTRGRSFKIVDKYVNIEELQYLITPHSDRVLKQDCLDLPDKIYQKRYVQLTDNQRKMYNSLKKEMVAEHEGKTISAPLALTGLLRLQQIVGGFFQPDPEIDFDEDMTPIIVETKKPQRLDIKNPRVESVIDLLSEIQGKTIIFARFRAELEELKRRIDEEFWPGYCVEYHGGVLKQDRMDNIHDFQTDPMVKVFLGNVQTAGKGLTLHAATTVIYYSNDFSLENRLQSEDRAHRIGQNKNVTYIDVIAQDTLDVHIVDILRSKKSIADIITGDQPLDTWV